MAISDIFGAFRKAKSDLESRLKALRSEIEAKQRERDAIRTAPAARADVKAAMTAYIGTLGADYTTALQSTIANLARQPHVMAGMVQAPGKLLRTPILGVAEPMADHPSTKALDSAFAALFRPALVQAVEQLIDAMPWPSEGLPLDQRAPKVDALTLSIEKLLAEEQELLAEAQASGVHISSY